MNEYKICYLQTNDPVKFEEKINQMVLQGFEPEGPISVFPMVVESKFGSQPQMAFIFVLLLKRFK
jgi:hypothetical protein